MRQLWFLRCFQQVLAEYFVGVGLLRLSRYRLLQDGLGTDELHL